MPSPIAIVISLDGLRASALGAYGGGWSETPALDRLASQSQVFDWMYGESPAPADLLASMWAKLGLIDGSSRLFTDDPQVAAQAEGTGFGEVLLLEGQRSRAATDVAETATAQLFAAAAEGLASLGAEGERAGGQLLWIHARAFRGPWDAPHEMREALLDEEDPPAATFVDPPRAVGVDDQDELLIARTAYGAQAAALDECVGGFLTAVDELNADERLLVAVIGSTGFPLGEHGTVGDGAAELYGETLHVPCLIRTPAAFPPVRDGELRRPIDAARRIAAWLRRETPIGDAPPRYLLARSASGDAMIRTDQWMLLGRGSDAAAIELYVKPDDRWEANDVASRCPDVVEELLALLARSRGDDPSDSG